MRKYILLFVLILTISSCNQRRQVAENNLEIIETDLIVENEKIINLPPAGITRDISWSDNSYYSDFNKYILRNPVVDELISITDIERLEIHVSLTNYIEDFSFLENMDQLRDLRIFGLTGIRHDINLNFLKYLQTLETLWFSASTDVIDGLYFSNLLNLKDLQFTGRVHKIINLEHILNLPNLETLFFDVFEKIVIENISEKSQLLRLWISSPQIDLAYIGSLLRLNNLRLSSDNIVNMNRINNPELETLRIDGYLQIPDRFTDRLLYIDWIQNLYHLNHFAVFRYDIYDVRPLLYLPNLETVIFRFNTIDVMPLLDSNSIRTIRLDLEYAKTIDTVIFRQHGITIFGDIFD